MIVFFTNQIYEYKTDLLRCTVWNLDTGSSFRSTTLQFFVFFALLRIRIYSTRPVTWRQLMKLVGSEFDIFNFVVNYYKFKKAQLTEIDLTYCIVNHRGKVRLAPNITVQEVKQWNSKDRGNNAYHSD